MKLYKVLSRNEKGQLVSCNGGNQVWTPGEKVSVRGPLVPCENGIHACREEDLLHWLNDVICPVVKASRERIIEDDKVVLRWAVIGPPLETWNDRSARLFTCDCAEWALSLLAAPDQRSIEAVRVARLYAIGEATGKELAAAWDAARDAARDAAWAAACDAACDAAGAAAWAAAGAAAGDYTTERLMEYLEGRE